MSYYFALYDSIPLNIHTIILEIKFYVILKHYLHSENFNPKKLLTLNNLEFQEFVLYPKKEGCEK